jgi:citrate lyase subunit gamma (acyl carrier protein)
MAVTDGLIVIEDKGALDYAIRARVQAAVLRGAACEELNWEQLS